MDYSINKSNDDQNFLFSNFNPTIIEDKNKMEQTFKSSFNQNTFEINNSEDLLAQKNIRTEEEIIIKKLMQKQMKEINDKRDMKNKARDIIENFNQKRKKNNELRHNANVQDERLEVDTRVNSKQHVIL